MISLGLKNLISSDLSLNLFRFSLGIILLSLRSYWMVSLLIVFRERKLFEEIYGVCFFFTSEVFCSLAILAGFKIGILVLFWFYCLAMIFFGSALSSGNARTADLLCMLFFIILYYSSLLSGCVFCLSEVSFINLSELHHSGSLPMELLYICCFEAAVPSLEEDVGIAVDPRIIVVAGVVFLDFVLL